MSYLPTYRNPPSPMICVHSPESLAVPLFVWVRGNPVSTAWQSANRAYYIPFSLRTSVLITQLWSANGATASNNLDIGIYNIDGTKIVSTGSTAMTGTATVQTVSITPISIGPGSFYLAMAMNGTTGTIFTYLSSVNINHTMNIYNQSTAFPLPATATFATAAGTGVPVFGLTIQE